MSNPLAQAHDHLPGSDRRVYSRQPIRSLAYVELDEGNGGIVLNVSEGGLAVQAVTSLMDDVLPGVRFQLSESEGWIQANARITWTGQSRKLAGLEFIDLPGDARNQIKEWLLREALPLDAAIETGAISKDEPSAEVPETHEGALSIAPAVEQGFAQEDHSPDAAPAPESGVGMPGAPISAHVQEFELESGGQSADAKPLSAGKLIANRWAAAVVLLLLAVASLAAGWAAGQGQLTKFLWKFRAPAPQNGADNREMAPNSTIPVARVSEIEVVSASNQRWTIPFNGPLNTPADGARQQPYGNVSSQTRKPQAGFRTWILSPPQQTRTAADEGSIAKENPPVMADSPSGTENVLTSSGAINAHALAEPPPLRVPDPPAPTGIVKQGRLIRRLDPVYPKIARDQRAEGIVRLNVTVGADGVVRGIAVLGGPPLLLAAAETAVLQWRYSPTTVDGKPVEFQREVDLTFHLATPSH